MQATETSTVFIGGFSWADWLIVTVISLSILIGMWRGFIREALSLVTWGAAIFFALLYCTALSHILFQQIQTPAMRILAAFATIFFSILIIGTIFSKIISSIVKKSGLSHTDRAIGFIFGALRGILMIILLISFGHLIHLDQSTAWQNSILAPKFSQVVEWLHHQLPNLLSKNQAT